MNIAIIALTRNGTNLAVKLGPEIEADIYIKDQFADLAGKESSLARTIDKEFSEFVGGLFKSYDALVFIMACGIVVRTIAPYIADKTKDPAVVVIDELGKFSISLLSGHIGGANSLAERIAKITGGMSVITTATDINNVVAFDMLAVQNDCSIENIDQLKFISSKLVNGGSVALITDLPINGKVPGNIVLKEHMDLEGNESVVVVSNKTDMRMNGRDVLKIRPRNLILGIGCKRGTTVEDIVTAVNDFLARNQRSILSLGTVATIDIKENEQGLLDYSRYKKIPLKLIQSDRIREVEDQYTSSGFVKANVGVSSVAEPCAVLAGKNARLICKKTIYHGITLALAEEEKVFKL